MGYQDLELRHLAALRAVAAERSFGRAAVRLGFTQSAVSQQIANLERVVGVAMFDRPGGSRPVELTPAGELLVTHAEAIFGRLELAGRELSRLQAGDSGRLTVGTFQSVAVKVLPEVVGRLRRESPGVEVRFVESDDDRVLTDRLLSGELDITFMIARTASPRLDFVELGFDPFVVIAPIGDPATKRGWVTARELGDGPLVGQPATSCQLLIESELRAAGVEPTYVFSSSDNAAVQAMVRAGAGRALLPFLAVDAQDPEVVLLALNPPMPPRRIGLATAVGRTVSPALWRFSELCQDVFIERARFADQVLNPPVRKRRRPPP